MSSMDNLTSNELINRLAPLIEPLKNFESLVDKEEIIKRNCQQKRNNAVSSMKVMCVAAPVVSFIVFFILNFEVILKHPPFIVKLMVLAVIALPVYYFHSYFKPVNEKKFEEIMLEENQLVEEIKSEQTNAIAPYWNEITECIPPKYQYSFAVNAFCSYLQNCRASNLKEAINLYEEEMHRNRMEQMQSEMLHQQKYQTALAAVSAVANVATAINTASAASSLASIRDR